MIALFPWLVRAVLLVPISLGMGFTLLSAFGLTPGLEGGGGLNFEPWHQLVATPGLVQSVRLSITSGLFATLLALGLAVAVAASWHETRVMTVARRWLPPALAVPHAAFAIGFAFLIAPSGWLARLFSPWLTGWVHPPDVAIIHDANGLALTLALVCKEFPFLSLALIAALGRGGVSEQLYAARALGYGPVMAWLKVVWPTTYRLIRFPVLVVLAYGVSAAEPAIILGPTTPPTLMVLILRTQGDPDLSFQSVAAALALMQLCLAGLAVLLWTIGERISAAVIRPWLVAGGRGGNGQTVRWWSGVVVGLVGATTLGAVCALAVWAMADIWRYPAPLPTKWSLNSLETAAPRLVLTAGWTIGIALVTTLIALVLVIGNLEAFGREAHGSGHQTTWPMTWVALPLLMPQATFLVGVQTVLLALGGQGGVMVVVWAHLLQTLPYVHLVLIDPWRAFDPRLARQARALGTSPARYLWRVKFPMLLRPILISAAVGFAVSVGQYLPTLFAGGGRISTLTTEAVALSSGGDPRVTAVHAFAQAALPLIGFSLALAIPAWRFRNRRGMALQ